MGKAAQSDHSVAESSRKGAKARAGNEHSSLKEASTKKQDSMFQKMFQSSLVSCSTWDIYSPPPSNSFSGKVVPRVLNRHKNRRKLSLEVHKVTPSSPDANDGGKKSKTASRVFSYEECVLRYDPICPCKVHVHDTVVQILTLSASTFNLFLEYWFHLAKRMLRKRRSKRVLVNWLTTRTKIQLLLRDYWTMLVERHLTDGKLNIGFRVSYVASNNNRRKVSSC